MGVAEGNSLGCCGARKAPRQGACTLVDPSLAPSPHPSYVPVGTQGALGASSCPDILRQFGGGGGRLLKVAHHKLTGHVLYLTRAPIPRVS